MDKLNISGLKRNPEIIKSYLKTIKNTVVTTEDIQIVFPERYINRELAIIANTIKLVSIYAILDNYGNYAIMSAPIIQELVPFSIHDLDVNGVIYKGLSFNRGDVVLPNTVLVKNNNFMYDIFDEFYIKGNIPWYLDYNDVSNVLAETKKYAGSNIGNNPLTMEIITSMVAKDPNNKQIYFRQVPDNKNIKPEYVGLSDIYNSYNNTGSRLIGGYFSYGITTSLVSPEKESSTVSKILMS
jgi:hypothetical protein